MTNGETIRSLASALKDITLDILLNNAGIYGGDHQDFGAIDYAAWLETLKVNTLAPMQMAEIFYPQLKRSTYPKIISISSQMGALQRDGSGAIIYRSSKAALNKAMQTLAQDISGQKIIVCVMHPGWVQTDMGGPNAAITAIESVTGLRNVIAQLTMQNTGKFYQWDGQEHVW